MDESQLYYSDIVFAERQIEKKTIDVLAITGLSLETRKRIASANYNKPQLVKNTIKLMQKYSFPLEVMDKLPVSAFARPNSLELLISAGFSIETINQLPDYAFKYAEKVVLLIKKYNIPLDRMTTSSELEKLIDEYFLSVDKDNM